MVEKVKGEEKNMKELTEEEMIENLVEAGWIPNEAENEVKRMLKEAAEEDGYDD